MIVLAAAVFFASGFAALLYQVIWQRMLVIFSGADVYSATIIVAAFMGGLGAGNLAGGYAADRASRRTALLLFGGAEVAIAAFGYFSSTLYYDVLYGRFGHLPIPPAATAAILFASLLWPTFFMGASLPLLARTLTSRIERAASVIGVLYGFNTLGAAVGAIASTWVLLPQMGLDGSLRVGAMLNLACAALLVPAAGLFKASRPAGIAATEAAPPVWSAGPDQPGGASTLPFWVWASIFGLSGLVALSLEILWFRLLGVMVKSTAFTFGTLLGVYLTGIGLGALAGSVLAPRLRQPAAAFLRIQAAVGLSAAALLTLFIRSADNIPSLYAYFGSYEPVDVRDSVTKLGEWTASFLSGAPAQGPPWTFPVLYLAVPLVLVLPPTMLMGLSFPVLQRVVQTDLAKVGRRVGLLLLANVLGSMAGTLLTGWVLLDTVGAAGTLRLVAVTGGLFAWLGLWLTYLDRPPRWRGRSVDALGASALAAAALVLPVLAATPGATTLWARLHGTTPSQIIVGEDGSGVSIVKTSSNQAMVYVNGVGQSTLPYGDVHTALGALPAFIHAAPTDAAIIGLGSGDTLHAVAGRQELERITCIEIIRPQIETLRALSARFAYGGLRALLADRRIEQVFGDGRLHLKRSGRSYDLIEADALRPGSAYSGNLYSEEYFSLVRDHLRQNGLAATWAPSQRVFNGFLRVFPHVLSLPGVLIGSNEPIVVDREAVARRLAASGAHQYYAAAGIDIDRLMTSYLAQPAYYGPEFSRDTLTDVNTDLFPRDEYDLGY